MWIEENEVIEFIKERIKDDYKLEEIFYKEFREHCENVGSDIIFFFKWEKESFRIETSYKEEEHEIIYKFKIEEC